MRFVEEEERDMNMVRSRSRVPMEEDIVDEDIDEKENIDEPFVGQCFLSEEEAFVFYVKYAIMKGFSV
ncbi:hypothetical protein Tco_0732162 [Tanacetum coccineum]